MAPKRAVGDSARKRPDKYQKIQVPSGPTKMAKMTDGILWNAVTRGFDLQADQPFWLLTLSCPCLWGGGNEQLTGLYPHDQHPAKKRPASSQPKITITPILTRIWGRPKVVRTLTDCLPHLVQKKRAGWSGLVSRNRTWHFQLRFRAQKHKGSGLFLSPRLPEKPGTTKRAIPSISFQVEKVSQSHATLTTHPGNTHPIGECTWGAKELPLGPTTGGKWRQVSTRWFRQETPRCRCHRLLGQWGIWPCRIVTDVEHDQKFVIQEANPLRPLYRHNFRGCLRFNQPHLGNRSIYPD